MTVKDLIKKLKTLPDDAVVTYRHNKYGRIDVEDITYTEEELLFGKKMIFVTLEGEKGN